MWIVNGHHIRNVLKATHHLDAFASKYVDCLFYGSFCEGICLCVVLDVLRPWKGPGKKRMLRLGVGWALAAYSWLCLAFWRAPSKNPCRGLIPSSSHGRCPLRVPPYKDGDVSSRQPRLWPRSLQLRARSEVRQVKAGLPSQGSSPKCWPAPAPGKCLTPWTFPLKCKAWFHQPSGREDTVSCILAAQYLEAFEIQVKLVETCIEFGGKDYFLWGSPLGPRSFPRGRSHILVPAFLMMFL